MATTATKIGTQWIYWKNNAGLKTNIDDFCLVLLSGFSETIDLIMNRIYYLPIISQRVLQKHNDIYINIHIYINIYIYGGIVKFHLHWESIGIVKWQPLFKFQIKLWQVENHLDLGEFNKVLLYEKLGSKNTLFEGVHFDRSGLPLQRVHCFQREFFSGGTSKEVRPLERGDSPRMSRRLRPGDLTWPLGDWSRDSRPCLFQHENNQRNATVPDCSVI